MKPLQYMVRLQYTDNVGRLQRRLVLVRGVYAANLAADQASIPYIRVARNGRVRVLGVRAVDHEVVVPCDGGDRPSIPDTDWR